MGGTLSSAPNRYIFKCPLTHEKYIRAQLESGENQKLKYKSIQLVD